MGQPTVRELLNRLRWGAGEAPAGVEIDFVARGDAGEGVEVVHFADVVEILPAGITLSGDTFIPYHRMRRLRRGGEVLWRTREKRGGDEG